MHSRHFEGVLFFPKLMWAVGPRKATVVRLAATWGPMFLER